MKWQAGRLHTGYLKKTIVSWKFFDMHILKFPLYSVIHPHLDPVEKGKKHFRMNIILKNAKLGGNFVCKNVIYRGSRIKIFRPDLELHSVTQVARGTRYVLSIGLKV